jgi:hypothetical protein
MRPDKPGYISLWIFTSDEAYKLRLAHVGPTGVDWTMQKHSDGTTYRLHQDDGEAIRCSCPGGTAYGPGCGGGRGCKHARMIRALRQQVDPGI